MCNLIFSDANVITMDPALPRAELVAIDGSQIIAVAGNGMLGRLKGQGTQVIDCMGKTLLPGFIDAHCHVHAYAESLVSLNLSPQERIGSISDIQREIRDSCRHQPAGSWVRSKGCNEFYITERRLPNRWELDAAAPLHPVKITHRSGHAHILNSLALKLVDISDETGDPPQGLIDRDPETGAPTGILYGMGAYIAGKIPPLDDAEMNRGLALANEKLLSYGITSVQDASSRNDPNQWLRFEKMKAQGIFQPRLTMMMGWKGFEESPRESLSARISGNELGLGGVKIIADQVTGSLYPRQEELNEQISAINRAGFQAVIHAVEEPVIEAVCNAVAYALNLHPRLDHRHRVEHCSVCPPALLQRLVELGIMAVTQPSFIYNNGDRYLETVPTNQLEHLYPIGSMLRRGLATAAGSDFPISDPNPLVGIGAAVTRTTSSNKKVMPQQGISVSDALGMYTLGAAAAEFKERIKGTISPGKVADAIILDEDPFTVDPERIRDIQVIMTMLGGKVVWQNREIHNQM